MYGNRFGDPYYYHFFTDFKKRINTETNYQKYVMNEMEKKEKRIQKYIAANTYYNRDFNDNHKYNYLREIRNEKKNRQLS